MSDQPHQDPSATVDAAKLHEENVISIRFVKWAAGGLATLVVVSLGFLVGMYNVLASRGDVEAPLPESLRAVRPIQTEPPLSADLNAQLSEMRSAETEQIESYAWVDEKQGIARIPVERAMELILTKDPLPVRGKSATPKSKPATEDTAEPKEQPQPAAKDVPEPKAKAKDEPEPKAKAKDEPKPKSDAEAKSKDEPEPKAKAKDEPEPKDAPDSKSPPAGKSAPQLETEPSE